MNGSLHRRPIAPARRASSHNERRPVCWGDAKKVAAPCGGSSLRRPLAVAWPLVPPLIAWGLCLTTPEQGGADVMAIKDDTAQGGPAQQPVHNGGPSGVMSLQDVAIKEVPPIADPAPLGLAAFALTTFLLSAFNAGWTKGTVAFLGLRAGLRRHRPAAGRHVGVPQPQRLRRHRLLHLRRLLDRRGRLLLAGRPAVQADRARAQQRPGLDLGGLRDLQHVHAAVEPVRQPGRVPRLPDPRGHLHPPGHRELLEHAPTS